MASEASATAAGTVPTVMPEWTMPAPVGPIHPLHVLNSLTRTKVPFVPMKGNDVFWYACGPTVYAPSHMGHAR
jgi:cysteinyl-tRNA synthetase